MRFIPEGHARLDSVMFVPLLKDGKGIGLLGLANKPGGFTDADARLGAALGDMAALALGDTGIGMDAAIQERIFEPFFSTKPKWEGAGLGLSAVHGAIAQHQGAIRVTSEPGKGATFELFLPAQ